MEVEECAEIFRALADMNRVRIAMILKQEGEMSVGVLAQKLGISQPMMSYHLRILKMSGLVRERKDGAVREYSLEIDKIASAFERLGYEIKIHE